MHYTPIEIHEITLNNKQVFFKPPVILQPEEDRDRYKLIGDCEFGLVIQGNSINDLVDDFEDQFNFVWKEYVLCDIRTLSEDAIRFRIELASRVTHA